MYPGQVRFEYHPYPYSDFGLTLAQGLEAAGEQGKFWEMHNRMVEDAPENMAELVAVAEAAGLNTETFTAAIDSRKFAEKVRAAKESAAGRGVGEVALFINGKEYQKSPGTLDDLIGAIEDELTKTKQTEEVH